MSPDRERAFAGPRRARYTEEVSSRGAFVKLSIVVALIVGGSFLAGCGDSSGPSNKASTTVSDASGDTFGSLSVQWDITAFTVTRDTNNISVALDFTANPHSSAGGASNATIGVVEFDTDQDSTTGDSSLTNFYQPAAATGMGVDFAFVIDTTVLVINSNTNSAVGKVHPVFSGRRLSFTVPRSLLGGEDGFLNAAAIIGTPAEPTDVVPNTGHLSLNGPIPAAPYMPAAGTRRSRVQRGVPLPGKWAR
jgi:hypothetical protein